jgi:serine/threonine protein kinase
MTETISLDRPEGETPPKIPDHEMLRRIGRGAYGEVWLARSATGAYRAVKVISRRAFDHDRPYDREFNGVKNFEPVSRTSESQVDILHVGRNDAEGWFYYVMELADDQERGRDIDPATYRPRTLRSELYKQGRLSVTASIELGLQLARALEHLHAYNLVHRDIKPSNILFVNGAPKLGDIGLVAGADATRSFVGTEGYVPVEGPGTPQADLYALGKVLYETCTGQDRLDYPELPTAMKGFADRQELLRLNETILRACDEDRTCRFQTATELREALECLKAGKAMPTRSQRDSKRLRRVAIVVSVLTVLGLGLGLKYSWRSRLRTINDQYRRATSVDWPSADRDPRGSGFVPPATRPASATNWEVWWFVTNVDQVLVGNVWGGPEPEVVADNGKTVRVLSGRGQLLTEFPVEDGSRRSAGGSSDSPAVAENLGRMGCLGEISGAGKLQLITHARRSETQSTVRILGDDGRELNSISVSRQPEDRPPIPFAAVDVDGDGTSEILAAVCTQYYPEPGRKQGKRGLVVLDLPRGTPKWESYIGPYLGWRYYARVGVVTIDGKPRLLHGSGGPNNEYQGADGSLDGVSYVYCYEPSTGKVLWRRAFDGLDEPGFYDATVLLPDLDGDGIAEVVATTSRHGWKKLENRGCGTIRLLNPRTGEDLKVVDFQHRTDSGVFGDLDGDGKDEVVIDSFDGTAGYLRSFGENLEAKGLFRRAGGRWTPHAICDLDGDGKAELIAVFEVGEWFQERSSLVILDHKLERVLWEDALDRKHIPRVMVVDLELDGTRQILVVSGSRLIALRPRPK